MGTILKCLKRLLYKDRDIYNLLSSNTRLKLLYYVNASLYKHLQITVHYMNFKILLFLLMVIYQFVFFNTTYDECTHV